MTSHSSSGRVSQPRFRVNLAVPPYPQSTSSKPAEHHVQRLTYSDSGNSYTFHLPLPPVPHYSQHQNHSQTALAHHHVHQPSYNDGHPHNLMHVQNHVLAAPELQTHLSHTPNAFPTYAESQSIPNGSSWDTPLQPHFDSFEHANNFIHNDVCPPMSSNFVHHLQPPPSEHFRTASSSSPHHLQESVAPSHHSAPQISFRPPITSATIAGEASRTSSSTSRSNRSPVSTTSDGPKVSVSSPSPSADTDPTSSSGKQALSQTSGSASRDTDPDGQKVKKCSHCEATTTPMWRRHPSTLEPLCNACGLYLQARKQLRPRRLIDDDGSPENLDSQPPAGGKECSHCLTRFTSAWRRGKEGEQLCNACGVYLKLRGVQRPLELRVDKVKRRAHHNEAKPA